MLVVVACGSKGGGSSGNGGGGYDPGDDRPRPVGKLTTDVKLQPLAYEMPTMTTCLKRVDSYQLPAIPAATLKIDGSFDEWTKIPSSLTDPVGDADPAYDIGDGAVAVKDEDVALAVSFKPAADKTLNFEWGGVVAQKGVLNSEVRRILRYANGNLEEYQDGLWSLLAPEDGRAVVGAHGIELLFSRRAVGDVVTWPVWWIRAFTRDEAHNIVMDSTAAAYFPSILNPDDAPFSFSSCDRWNGQRLPFAFVQIQDSKSGLNARERDFPIDSVAEWSQQLARLAFDSAVDMLGGGPVPVGRMTLLATVNKVAATKPFPGIDPTWFGDPTPYRGLITDATRLAPDTTAGYPQGAVLEDGASRFIDMYLQNLMPSAPLYLIHGMRQAILDQLVVRYVGMSYWLDYFSLGVEALLKKSDVMNPVPIPEMAVGTTRDAKIMAFGHLLGRDLTSKDLVLAWQAAAQAVKSGEVPAAALKRTLIQQRGDNQGLAKRLASLWQGWLEKSPYNPALAPESMADKDLDGLPNFLETKFGTRFDKSDTDEDGWSDMAEVVLGTDPKLENKAPAVIVPDGDFSDWQMLLPQRMTIDKGVNGTCPKAADINYYTAVANRDYLIIAAVAADFWIDEPAAHWEAVIDLPKQERQVLVTGASDSQELIVKRVDSDLEFKRIRKAFPVARKTIEWAVHRSAFGLDSYFNGDQGVRIRLRTVYTQDSVAKFCDETGWFSPIISG